MRRLINLFIVFFIINSLFAQESAYNKELSFYDELEILKKSYPDVVFIENWNNELQDYEIEISVNDKDGTIRKTTLYRAEGRYISQKQLSIKENYRKLLYSFPLDVMDPSTFSDELLGRINNFSSKENRTNGAVTGTAFFDAIYGTINQNAAASHMKKITIFGFTVTVHERIIEPLKQVEKQINLLSLLQTEEAKEIRSFLKSLNTVDCYLWRNIRDTQGRSFHSMGLAVDFLPKDMNSKAIYWNWERNAGNDKWMLIPLKNRWMPPKCVIDAFEKEGFCWGGKWAIWDNMHFEYRPELLICREYFN